MPREAEFPAGPGKIQEPGWDPLPSVSAAQGDGGAPSLFVVSAEKSALSGHESSDLFSHLRKR